MHPSIRKQPSYIVLCEYLTCKSGCLGRALSLQLLGRRFGGLHIAASGMVQRTALLTYQEVRLEKLLYTVGHQSRCH